jgi:hypothetical protein
MEEKVYKGLMDFLCNPLTPSELKRLGEQLVNHAKMKEEEEELFRPYTMEELNAMLDEAESQEGIPDEEAWDEEELALIEKYKPVLAEAV